MRPAGLTDEAHPNTQSHTHAHTLIHRGPFIKDCHGTIGRQETKTLDLVCACVYIFVCVCVHARVKRVNLTAVLVSHPENKAPSVVVL